MTTTVTQGNSVIDKIGFLVRFWELRGRHATLGEPLGPSEQIELLSLMQLVTAEFKMPLAGPVARPRTTVPAQLIGEGAIVPVEIRRVSAAAVIVASLATIGDGARVILRTADAVSGVEYALPCVVAWSHAGAPCTIALVVDGIPTCSDFGRPADVPVRSSISMGRRERLVG